MRQTLLRSALPSAVRQDGVHLQPRPFHLLAFPPIEGQRNARLYRLICFSLKPPEFRSKILARVFSRPRLNNRHTGRNTGSQGIKKDRRLFSYGQFNIKFYIVRFGLSSYGVCSSAMDIYSSSLCCSKPAIISANGARSPFTA